MRIHRLIVAVILVASASAVRGYEETTHRTLTLGAVSRSVLQLNPAALADLGLKAVDDGTQKFPNSQNALGTIADLLQDGSDFEDSLFPTIRLSRHWYDPITGLGLNIPLLPTQMSSPDWALARPGTVSAQESSYGDARQSLKDALTQPTEEARKAAFGKTFQALGQVVHHLQDMAQPQHVRNDVHCRNFFLCAPVGAYAPSRYEKWTQDKEGTLPLDPVGFSYDITSPTFTSTFNSPRRFWHTTPPDANSPAVGKGIAEFTNGNFVSAGTNFRFNNGTVSTHPLYTRPAPGQAGNPVPVTELFPNGVPSSVQFGCKFTDDCFMTFYSTAGTDPLTGLPFTNDRASTLSIFDQDLQTDLQQADPATGLLYTTRRIFALNGFNFDAAHQFLIPLAVAYSAGMINYFFRGKIDLVEDDDNLGTYLIKNLGNEPMTGTFALYYDYDDANAGTVNNRKLLISWDKTIPANGQLNIGTIPFPSDPAPKNPDEFMLVFAGDMGEETRAQFGTGAVAGKVVTLTPVLLFAVTRFESVSVLTPLTSMEFNFILPEKYAQKIRSNPTAFSIQVGGVTSPPTSISVTPNGCFHSFFQIVPPNGCVRLDGNIGDALSWRFSLTHNNEFVAWTPEQGALLVGDSPKILTPDFRDRLCGSPVVDGNATQKAPFIDSTELELSLEGLLGLVPIKVFHEGKVLFEFEASPTGGDNLAVPGSLSFDSILSNTRNIRLTKAHCRVTIQ